MPYPSLRHPEPLSLQQTTAYLYLHRSHSNIVRSQSLWGPCVLVHIRFVWALWAFLAGMGFDSKCEFTTPTIFLGFLLCTWTWGISSQLLQCLPSDPGRGVSPHSCASAYRLTLDVGYLHMASPAKRSHHSWLWTWASPHSCCSWPKYHMTQ